MSNNFYQNLQHLRGVLGGLNLSTDIKDKMQDILQKVQEECHTKIDIFDIYKHETDQKLTYERQINIDLHERCDEYDALLIEMKSFITMNSDLHRNKEADELVRKINATYGLRIKDHSRTYLCDLQAQNEQAPHQEIGGLSS
jgi:hypothetical protein